MIVRREHITLWLRMWVSDFDLDDHIALHSALHRGRGKVRLRFEKGVTVDGLFKPFDEEEKCPLCPPD